MTAKVSAAPAAAWFLWLAAVTGCTLPAWFWILNYFKHPGLQFYRLFLLFLCCLPVLIAAWHAIRKRWLWRYELAILAGVPVAASLVYRPKAAIVTIWVFLACYATGRRLLELLRLRTAGGPQTLALSAGAGFGVLFCVLFLAGLAGLYFWWLFAAILALPCLAFRREIRGLTEVLKSCRRGWTAGGFSSPLATLVVVFALLFVLCAAMVVLSPSLAFDVLYTHLPSAEYYAAHHALRPVPNISYSFFPQSIETLMAMGYILAGQPASQMLPSLFIALAVLVCFHIARECGATRLAAFTGCLFAVSVPAFHWTGSVAKNDFALAFFILAALDCYLMWQATGQFNWIRLGVFFLAMGAGVKHIIVFALPPFAVLYLYAVLRSRRRLPALASLVAIFIAFGLFWHVRDYVLTGNPVYPQVAASAASDAASRHAKGWWTAAARYAEMPWDLHFHGDHNFESVLRNPLGIGLLLFAPVWFLTRQERIGRAERVCLFAALSYLVYWSFSVAMIRFAIAPFMLLFLLTGRRAVAFYSAGGRAMRVSLAAATGYALVFALCAAMIIEINGPQLHLFAGSIDDAGYLREALAGYRCIEVLRARWKPEDRVFGVGNCSLAYGPDPSRFDCVALSNGQYSPEEVAARLRQQRYSYLILPGGSSGKLLAGLSEPIYRDADSALYSLAQ